MVIGRKLLPNPHFDPWGDLIWPKLSWKYFCKCTCSSATSSYHIYFHILIGRSNFFVRTIGRKVSRACHAPLSLKLPSQPYSFSDNYDFFWFLLFLQGTVETISPQNLDQTLHDFFQPSLDHCNKSPWYLRGDFTIVINIVMITITNINSIIIIKTRSIISALPKSLL